MTIPFILTTQLVSPELFFTQNQLRFRTIATNLLLLVFPLHFLLYPNKVLGISKFRVIVKRRIAHQSSVSLLLLNYFETVDGLRWLHHIRLHILLRLGRLVIVVGLLRHPPLVQHDHEVLKFLLEQVDDLILPGYLPPQLKNFLLVSGALLEEQIGTESSNCRYSLGGLVLQFLDLF